MPEESVLDFPAQDTSVDAGSSSGILGDSGLGDSIQSEPEGEISEPSEILGQVDGEEASEGVESGEPDQKTVRAREDAQRTAITKYLRELRGDAKMKDVAEALNKAYFRDSEYQKLFPNMDELRNLKSTLDIMGGPEVISKLQDLEIGVEAMDRMVDEGNPQIIQDMATESPDGFKKLVPIALGELEKLDARAYAEALRPHLVRGISQSGLDGSVSSTLQLLAKAYNATDPEHSRFYLEQAHSQMAQVDQWLKSMAENMQVDKNSTIGQPSAPTGAQKTTSGPQIDMESVRNGASEWAKKEFQASLKPFLQNRKMGDATINDLINGIAMEVDSRLSQDADFQEKLGAWARSGKTDRVLAWVKNGIDRVKADATRAVWERRYGGVKPAAQPTPQKAAPANNNTQKTVKKEAVTLQLPKRPPMDQLDMSRDPDRLLYITHRGYMKDGRMVQWK